MSFCDNLRHLRTTRNMTQEQLAMLLGVSHQSVITWETGHAYPEVDKLLVICEIFNCMFDDLVKGDLTMLPVDSSTVTANSVPRDIWGYDTHMKSYVLHVSLGIGIIILGVAAGVFFQGLSLDVSSSKALMMSLIFGSVCAGLALLIPACIRHLSFVKAHPFVQDFYTKEDKQRAARVLVRGSVFGIACILVGVLLAAFMESELGEGLLLLFIVVGMWSLVYFGMMYSRVNIRKYNNGIMKKRDR